MAATFSEQVPSGKAVTVRVIDTTSRVGNIKSKVFLTPDLPGFEDMPTVPAWSFLIEHESGRRLLFDLGLPFDWENMAPATVNGLKPLGWDIKVDKPLVEILKEHSIDPSTIEGLVWSHWHFDHIGNPNHFPPTTKLIFGPGVKEEFMPAYPTNPNAPLRDSDFEGRELQEITFTEPNSLRIGDFPAFDYFGDGSFYLLDTPGHATGHVAGLARTTTNPSTFILMGGDLTHHGSEMRPNPYAPLPDSIPASTIPNIASHLSCTTSCPGSIFESLQTILGRTPARTTPFLDPSMGKDIPLAIESIKKTMPADADENIFYIFAHDRKIMGVVDQIPKSANNWKEQGWREKLYWKFLEDFEGAVKEAKATL